MEPTYLVAEERGGRATPLPTLPTLQRRARPAQTAQRQARLTRDGDVRTDHVMRVIGREGSVGEGWQLAD